MTPDAFRVQIEKTLSCDSPYPVEALLYLADTIFKTLHQMQQTQARSNAQLAAVDIVLAFVERALDDYYLMAESIFKKWNIFTSMDIGNMVYILIQAHLFAPSKNDRIEDFAKLPPLSDIFDGHADRLLEAHDSIDLIIE